MRFASRKKSESWLEVEEDLNYSRVREVIGKGTLASFHGQAFDLVNMHHVGMFPNFGRI
jgi:hypothetical protein